MLVILIISTLSYFENRGSPPARTAGFIEPSRSVRW
jgi:hypothetical protein